MVLSRTTDIIMGGGRRYYVPESTPGSGRDDELDLLAMAKDTFGYRVIQNRSDFDNLSLDGTACVSSHSAPQLGS